MHVNVVVADHSHTKYAEDICTMMASAAKIRGTGIAKRQPEYISKKMKEGKAVIAIIPGRVVGFCYIENWENQKYVANSGLIVHPDFRKTGLAKNIKKAIFDLSKEKFPNALLFGITTSMAVMKINYELGYRPVTFSELTSDEKFWNGCQSCTNYDILQRTNKTMCICTGMLNDLSKVTQENEKSTWDNFMNFLIKRRAQVKQKAKEFPRLYKFINYGK